VRNVISHAESPPISASLGGNEVSAVVKLPKGLEELISLAKFIGRISAQIDQPQAGPPEPRGIIKKSRSRFV
jgi:hypothetical protein